MNEDFAPFELAVKLKEKGFREKCFAYYSSYSGTLHYNEIKDAVPSRVLTVTDFGKCHNYFIGNVIDAPSISQVLKWLRVEKKIHLIVEISDSGWYYTLYPNVRWENGELKSDKYIMSFKHKASCEQAALAGIEYVLNNLI